MAETERPSSNNSGECVHGSHLNLVTWGGYGEETRNFRIKGLNRPIHQVNNNATCNSIHLSQ